MANDNVMDAVLSTLISVLSQSSNYATALGATVQEVAALRSSVRGLDPTFDDVLADHRKNKGQASIEAIHQVVQLVKSNERMIQQLQRMQNELRKK